MTLLSTSLDRLSGSLPTFPGTSVVEQLVSGKEAARAVILKYVPNFAFDVIAAERVMSEVDAWAERKGQALVDAIDPVKNPGNSLPEQVSVDLGQETAKQFIIALYTEACSGMGPWTSGEVARIVAAGDKVQGTLISRDWAVNDADARLKAFGVIVSLDQHGELAKIMSPQGTSGLGLGPGWIALIIISVIVAAAIIVAVVVDRHLARNNALMREMCLKAQADGRDAVVVECVNATKELQAQSLGAGIVSGLARAAALVGVAFVAIRYGLPLILDKRGSSASRSA